MCMTKYVAFLRGINVGGRIIKMADLKKCCEAMGLKNVRTVLQSGNVLFESDQADLQKRIEAALQKAFDYPAHAQVVGLEDLTRIIDNYPFKNDDASKQNYVIFMENGLEKELIKEAVIDQGHEQVQSGNSVIYWQVDKGMTLKSDFAKYLTKAKYKDFNTNRNINTLRKLLD